MVYRTEIEIAPDRYVCLQLPDFIPAGRAVVTVRVTVADDPVEDEGAIEFAADDSPRDVEWWEEFDGDDPRRD